MYEKLVSHKLSSFAAQFTYWEMSGLHGLGPGCISHHLHKSLNAGMGFYIVQLDISTAFDRVSHNGLLFK